MPPVARRLVAPLALAALAACATSSSPGGAAAPAPGPTPAPAPVPGPEPIVSGTAPSPDPRVGLKAGWFDAGQAAWNLRLVSTTPPSAKFMNPSTPGDERLKNSDLAFIGTTVFQGNYSGWQAWDVSDPARPVLKQAYVCPGSQSDVTVYRNLLFVSAEATSGRTDCALGGVPDTVSPLRARGIRILDVSNLAKPRYIGTVQTCRGSHTNTLVTDPRDPDHVYIYVSGSAGVRSERELPGCISSEEDPNTALFRIEVIQVPLKNPSAARIVSSPRIFEGLKPAQRHGELPGDRAAIEARMAERGGPRERPGASRGPTQCHDITTYPAIGRAGGACSGYGILLDITDPRQPRRLFAVADTNFSAWHSVTFSNDGSKVIFTDEWGGGSSPRCRATDPREWGANAQFAIVNDTLQFRSYWKLPAPQSTVENCVAHNGSLIPIPGRDVMVQGWYQGGITVFDWTDPSNVREIAFFDRGPLDATRLTSAGSWSTYWYNGYIYSSEIARGLDILELVPSPLLSQNEIDAAKSVRLAWFNPQEQPRLTWPPSFALSRAYVDQLERSGGLAPARLAAVRAALDGAERSSGAARSQALAQLAQALDADATGSRDAAKVRMLAQSVRELAAGG